MAHPVRHTMLRKHGLGLPRVLALVLTLSFLLIAGCGANLSSGSSLRDRDSSAVPQALVVLNVPPDTLPAWLLADSLFVTDSDGDLVSTSVLQVYFEYGSTQSEKQAAIDLVGGTVVGAIHVDSGGIYYVLVKGDGTIATIDSLAVILRGLPQVWRATPHTLIGMGVGESR